MMKVNEQMRECLAKDIIAGDLFYWEGYVLLMLDEQEGTKREPMCLGARLTDGCLFRVPATDTVTRRYGRVDIDEGND